MTESEVVNGWIQQGETRGRIEERRQALLDILEGRFAEQLTPELVQWIKTQDSLSLMNEWSKRAVRAGSFEEFLAVLHQ